MKSVPFWAVGATSALVALLGARPASATGGCDCPHSYATEVLSSSKGSNQDTAHKDPTHALGSDAGTYWNSGSGGTIDVGFGQSFSNSGDSWVDLRIDEVGDPDCYYVCLGVSDPFTKNAMIGAGFGEDPPGFFEVKLACGDLDLDIDSKVPGYECGELRFSSVMLADDKSSGNGAEFATIKAKFVCPEPPPPTGECEAEYAGAVVKSWKGSDQDWSHKNPSDALGDTPDTYYSLGKGGGLEVSFSDVFSNSGNSDADLCVDEFGYEDCYYVWVTPADVFTKNALQAAGHPEPVQGYFELKKKCGDLDLDIDSKVPGHAQGALTFTSVLILDDGDDGNGAEIARVQAKFVCDGPVPFPCGPTYATEVVSAEPGQNQGGAQDPNAALGDTPDTNYSLGNGGCLEVAFGAPFSSTGDATPDLVVDEWNVADCYTVLVEPLDAATAHALQTAGFTEDAPGSGRYAIFSGCSDQQIDIDSLVPGHGHADLAFGSVRICDDGNGSDGAEIVRVFAEVVCPGLIAKLGDRVWVDVDRNGLQDDGEIGLPNVPVTLRDANTNAVVDQASTDALGDYLFCVKPGSYVVEFTIPDDFSFTTREVGGDAEVDSNPDEVTGRTDTIVLGPGQVRLDIDAGVVIDECVGTTLIDTNLPACNLPIDPVFTATAPNLGSVWTLTITSELENSLYFVWGSIGPPVQTVIPGSDCSIWINPFKLQVLMTGYTDANGSAEIVVPIPAVADWIGAEMTFVARICDPTTPGPILGFPDFFSNSMHVKLGCP